MWGYWLLTLIGFGIAAFGYIGTTICHQVNKRLDIYSYKLAKVESCIIIVFYIGIILGASLGLTTLLLLVANGVEYNNYIELYNRLINISDTTSISYYWQVIEYNMWYSEVEISKEMYGNFSQWFPFDNISYIDLK